MAAALHRAGMTVFVPMFAPQSRVATAYLVPVESGGIPSCSLRLGPTRTNQVVGILYAADYAVRPVTPPR